MAVNGLLENSSNVFGLRLPVKIILTYRQENRVGLSQAERTIPVLLGVYHDTRIVAAPPKKNRPFHAVIRIVNLDPSKILPSELANHGEENIDVESE
jgi:hypothetical protein